MNIRVTIGLLVGLMIIAAAIALAQVAPPAGSIAVLGTNYISHVTNRVEVVGPSGRPDPNNVVFMVRKMHVNQYVDDENIFHSDTNYFNVTTFRKQFASIPRTNKVIVEVVTNELVEVPIKAEPLPQPPMPR